MHGFWEFFWFVVVFFLLMAYLVLFFQIMVDIFRDRGLSGFAKAVWVFFLIVLPIITSLIYVVTRGREMTERTIAREQAAQSEADTYIRTVAAGAASPAEEIARAKSLLDTGAINETEYQTLKAKALA
ncbi:SHOCT domain-containing protein [Nocardioides sp. Iso805N]|uniref:SHOCT domain-containing protein n=1 Tax=Nocardioides sp. Iso805N TaxID=1283287 RepID=UPI00036E0B2C|nr:SHOCT domain-containing protein [Nocardioides sp. Iso805N]